MGIYDIAMLIIFGGAILFGYWKGLAWQIASIAALIVSYIVAVNFRDQLAGVIQIDPPWNRIGAMLILFLGTSLIVWTIYAAVSRSLKKHELKGFDRQAGAVVGAAKGALLCMVVTMFSVSLLGENAHEAIDQSRLGRYVEKGIWQISDYVPAEIARFVDPHIQSYKEASQHSEPNANPGDLINGITEALGGSVYPVDEKMNQDPRLLPPGGQPAFRNTGYPGTWQDSAPSSNPGFGNQSQPATNQNFRYPSNQNKQPSWDQTTGWGQNNSSSGNPGYPGTLSSSDSKSSGWANSGISEASRKILEDVRQASANGGLEAFNQSARNFLEGNQPSNADITEVANQIFEKARRDGVNMGFDSAVEQARKWLESQQR